MATEASVSWEIEGMLSVEFSVSSMLKVIATTTPKDTGKFLTWEGRVSPHTVALGRLQLNGLGTSMVVVKRTEMSTEGI